jgi:hypothetical protein
MSEKLKDQIYRESLFQSFQGLDTVSALTSMEAGYLRIAKNCNLTEDGAINKRLGCQYVNATPWAGGNFIIGGLNYIALEFDDLILFGADGTNGRLGVLTDPTITDIITGLAASKPSMFQFERLMFFLNGDGAFIYDGTAVSQIGIDPPTVAPTDGGDIAGDLVNTANYIWVYTYYNSNTGAESSPSSSFAVIVNPSGGRRINVTPGDPLTADFIRLYRTTASGAILFLDSEAAIGSTFIDSVIDDLGLGAELEIDNTRLSVWGEPRYGVVSSNRVFVTGFNDNPNRTRFSKIGKSGSMPESYQATGFCDCQSQGGVKDRNIGIGQANDTVIVIKPNSVGSINQLGSLNSDIAVDNVVFEYKEISRAVTALSHWGICNVLNNMVWMGSDNFYLTDGKQAAPIADKISNLLSAIQVNEETIDAYNDQKNQRVYFSCMVDPSALPDEFKAAEGAQLEKWIFEGSYRKFPEFKWTIHTPGSNKITHPGIIPGCFIARGKETYFGIGDTDYTTTGMRGRINRLNDGLGDVLEPDQNRGIFFKARDYPSKFGLDEEPKLWFKDYIHIGSDLNKGYGLRVYSVYDQSEVTEDFLNLRLGGDFAIWNRALWNRGTWGYRKIRYEYSESHRKAVYKQLEFQNFNADEPIKIYGYIKCARPEEFK